MKRLVRICTVLILVLGVGAIFTAFEWIDKPDIIIEGDLPTEFTVMQNDSPVNIDVSDKGCYFKNTKTGERKNISEVRVSSQSELGTHNVQVDALEPYIFSPTFYKEYNAEVTVVPFDPKLRISVPKVIKSTIWHLPEYLQYKELREYNIYAYNAVDNLIAGRCQITSNPKLYWGYNNYDGFFEPTNPNYTKTSCSLTIFKDSTTKIYAYSDRIFISFTNIMNSRHQARINGGKWRSIKETNKLKLKPNTKYKVEIRQKAESFHKAVILQTSYVKTKKSY